MHTIHGGDVIDLVGELEKQVSRETKVVKRNAVKDERRRWTDAVVPYTIESSYNTTQ